MDGGKKISFVKMTHKINSEFLECWKRARVEKSETKTELHENAAAHRLDSYFYTFIYLYGYMLYKVVRGPGQWYLLYDLFGYKIVFCSLFSFEKSPHRCSAQRLKSQIKIVCERIRKRRAQGKCNPVRIVAHTQSQWVANAKNRFFLYFFFSLVRLSIISHIYLFWKRAKSTRE